MYGEKKYNKDVVYFVDLYPGIKYKKLEKEELHDKIEKAKNGDNYAFEDILRHMHNYLCYLTKFFFIQGAEAQDVYQEGMIKLLNVIQKYDKNKGSFISFAQSSIRKHIITSINKEQAKKRKVLNQSLSLNCETKNQDGEIVTFADTITDEGQETKTPTPLDLVQKDHEEYIIEKISEVLSEMEQKIFVLRFIESMSYRDIAKELGLKKRNKKTGRIMWDQKSVDNAIWRSRPKIKKAMERLRIDPKALNIKPKKK